MLHGVGQVEINDYKNNNNNTENIIVGSKPMYVKAKMEGVAIARKIDMNLYHSYHTLKSSLLTMFSKCKWLLHQFHLLQIILFLCNKLYTWVPKTKH